MRIGRRSSWLVTRTALALAAMTVQLLLPFVLAADIAAAAETMPICHVPSGDDHKGGQPNPATSCPICAALAAAAVVTATAPPAIPLPRVAVVSPPAPAPYFAPTILLAVAYRSRAPPHA